MACNGKTWGIDSTASEVVLDSGVEILRDKHEQVIAQVECNLHQLPPNDVQQGLSDLANASPAERKQIIDEAMEKAIAAQVDARVDEALKGRIAEATNTFAKSLHHERSTSLLDKTGNPTIPLSLLPRTADALRHHLPALSHFREGQCLWAGDHRYTLIARLGGGGFAEVWETRNSKVPNLKHDAVKIFTHSDACQFGDAERDNMNRALGLPESLGLPHGDGIVLAR